MTLKGKMPKAKYRNMVDKNPVSEILVKSARTGYVVIN